jgi:hypothetical protein
MRLVLQLATPSPAQQHCQAPEERGSGLDDGQWFMHDCSALEEALPRCSEARSDEMRDKRALGGRDPVHCRNEQGSPAPSVDEMAKCCGQRLGRHRARPFFVGKKGQERMIASPQPAKERSIAKHDASARGSLGSRGADGLRPVEQRAPRVGRIGRRQDDCSAGIVFVAKSAKAIVGPRDRELSASAARHEVAAPNAALILQCLEYVVHGSEATHDALGVRRFACHDSIAIKQGS